MSRNFSQGALIVLLFGVAGPFVGFLVLTLIAFGMVMQAGFFSILAFAYIIGSPPALMTALLTVALAAFVKHPIFIIFSAAVIGFAASFAWATIGGGGGLAKNDEGLKLIFSICGASAAMIGMTLAWSFGLIKRPLEAIAAHREAGAS